MFRLLLSSLRFRWVEHLAAITMIALLVAAMVVQGSLSTSAEERTHQLAHELGDNILVLPARTDASRFHAMEFDDATFPEDYNKRLEHSKLAPHIGSARSQLYFNTRIGEHPAVIVGQSGLFPAEGQDATAAPALVGGALAARLGLAVHDRFMIQDAAFSVERVIRTLPPGLDMAVITDLAAAQSTVKKQGRINAMSLAGCWCSIDIPALARKVEDELPGTQAITAAGVVKSQIGTIKTMKEYSGDLFALALALIAALSALLTGFQIRRQKREIGLLIAIGASSTKIVAWLVSLAGLVTLTGSVAGILLAVPLSNIIGGAILGTPVHPSVGVVPPVLLLSLGVSAIGAAWPARRATRLDPTTILREA